MPGFLFPALFVAALSSATVISGPPRVTDGDTLSLGPVVVRLHGIDAPEEGQSCRKPSGGSWNCGAAATAHLEKLLHGSEVTCEALDHDRYGRVIARCEAGGRDIGAEMVAAGLAWAYTDYSDAYLADEADARAAGLGIWSAANQPAWEFRADRWARASANAPRADCPIKGNISKSGEKIYHTPWSPVYAKTVIREDQGERWFCDESEAQAAGWRAARWR